jgi:hypothetical protein
MGAGMGADMGAGPVPRRLPNRRSFRGRGCSAEPGRQHSGDPRSWEGGCGALFV